MPRKDRSYTTLDIIRITSHNMDTNELRLLIFWFQVVIPTIILADFFDENFVAKYPSKNRWIRFYQFYRKITKMFDIDIWKYLLELFLPKDYITVLQCIEAVKGKFGIKRGQMN